MGWSGIENGELLRLAASENFDALISTDKGIEYEQNQAALPLAVIMLLGKDNKLKNAGITCAKSFVRVRK